MGGRGGGGGGQGRGDGLDLIVPSVRLGSRELALSSQGCLGQKVEQAEPSEPGGIAAIELHLRFLL